MSCSSCQKSWKGSVRVSNCRWCGAGPEFVDQTELCTNESVGMLILRDERLLLIRRARVPYGWAPPAGHVDLGEDWARAATRELFEKTGLAANSLRLMHTQTYQNKCRRPGGDHHRWKVYQVDCPRGAPVRSPTETQDLKWVTRAELRELVELSVRHCRSHSSVMAWRSNPGLEPVWVSILDDIVLNWGACLDRSIR